ncbi:hypothetical protein HKW97_17895 [Pseudomonas luteola]|uniref:hypothetical protein n=1 Tax=Pseudomonas luteola TaxID=47886 RepID=UPI00388D079E
MKCPHCSASISFFSPAIRGPAKPGGARYCKSCRNAFKITRGFGPGLLIALAVAVAGFFLLRPIPTIGPVLWGVVTTAAVFIAIARLEKH